MVALPRRFQAAKSVQRLFRHTGGIKPRAPVHSTFRRSLAEREDILCGLRDGDSCRCIAARLRRHASTISRDVAANGGRDSYRPSRADDQSHRRRRRVRKLAPGTPLRRVVEDGLHHRWSPQQIVARLDWEGDLVLGRRGQSAIATLVERQSRFVMLVRLPNGRLARDVRDALSRVIRTLPVALRRSLTWDRGKEMGEHRRFTVDTGVPVYFCDRRSPWQRGTNENSNGLIRQYLPKGTDLSTHSQRHLNQIADELNGRTRQTLGWRTPSEVFTPLV